MCDSEAGGESGSGQATIPARSALSRAMRGRDHTLENAAVALPAQEPRATTMKKYQALKRGWPSLGP
jgi:hypothetical protein